MFLKQTHSNIFFYSILYLMCGMSHWKGSITLNCTRKKEQQSCKIIHFDGKESHFVSFILLFFSAYQISHNVSSSGSSTVWNCGKSLSLIVLAVLTVSSVVFLCEPNTFSSMLLKECGYMWNQNISTCGLSVWMANAPHVSLKRKHDVLRRIAKVYVEDDLERKEHKFNIGRAFVPLAILVAVSLVGIHAWGLCRGSPKLCSRLQSRTFTCFSE